MSEIYITSDSHFAHAKIIEYSARPFISVDHMHEEMRDKWNALVGPDDNLVHLGDCAFVSKWNLEHSRRFLGSLNGKKTIVLGNHDRKKAHQLYVELGWHVETKWFIAGDVLYSHYPFLSMGQAPSKINFNVHGHEHHHVERSDHYNVCVDLNAYTPINAKNIMGVDYCALRDVLQGNQV